MRAIMMQTNAVYDKRWLVWCLVGIVAMCAAMKVTGGAGFVLVFPLILMAFGKNRPELMLYCLLLTAVITMTNNFFAPKGMVFSLAARGVYLLVGSVLTLQIVGQRNSRLMTPLLSILAYVAYMAIVSSVGWQPMISYLKIILFVIIFFAFYSTANASATRGGVRPERVRSVILSFVCFIVFGSLALIPFPGIGKLGAAEAMEMGLDVSSLGLFKGITAQPQALGPMIATMGTLLFADLLFSVRRWDRLYVALLLGVPVLIYYTGSRTAMGTWLVGMGFVGFLFMKAQARVVGARWKQRALSLLTLMGVFLGIGLFSTPQMREYVARFALKYVSEESKLDVSYESMTATRQGLMDSAMDNFRVSPWIGNGFQVSRQMAEYEIDSWKQLLSAPIEKGVWVTAVLEEGGVFGMLLFVLFALVSFAAMLARQAFVGSSCLVVLLVSNLGEFTFFSMSGIGGVMWALVFAGLALDAQRLRQQRPMWGRRVLCCLGPTEIRR